MPKFRSETNQRLTRALFYETSHDSSHKDAIYTLKDEDLSKDLLSLRRLYIETNDITEYEFALKYLENWAHWQLLLSCDWFKPYVKAWRTELQTKLESAAFKVIVDEAQNPSSQNKFQASKTILDRIAKSQPQSKRGRPSAQEKEAELKYQLSIDKEIAEDARRINATSGREGST